MLFKYKKNYFYRVGLKMYNKDVLCYAIYLYCSQENYAHKYQLTEFVSAKNLINWPKDTREDNYYINEEGMYEFLFSSQQPKAKNFRKHCCNGVFPHIRQ